MRKKQYIKDIPRLAKEYNDEFPIDNITIGSGKSFYWICEKGHRWKSTPSHRTRGQNCPYCAGNIPIKGENDLSTVYPDVAKEWHPNKNNGLKPEDFKARSNKKVWWLCPKGHEYESIINARTSRGVGCPYCSGQQVIKGETDLVSLRPDIAKEWHPTKNGDIKPNTIPKATNIKYWWLCPRGHEFKMRVSDRTRKTNAQGCPYCSGKKPIIGESDLGTICKESNQFWDYDKNDTGPGDYLPYSLEKIWMKCDKGHSWKTRICDFTRNPKCPYCTGAQVKKGENTLRVLYPDIAEKWNCEKNATIDIDTVHVGSSLKKYWWKCEKGHEWIADIAHMVKKTKGKGCPYCAGSLSKYSI
ncbi:zinc-ribbon domain-containing protein [Desulfosporosinus sp. FKA]|uniref:zinc-ribbon domain-containing protein n=1 Tax=Desulfosporosinus sp. FKA TaxID=1969834 RepID=UPI000B49F41A|nr:zinc-ribbon domain-containing protein [Desulfosporosinus sp. FKA]